MFVPDERVHSLIHEECPHQRKCKGLGRQGAQCQDFLPLGRPGPAS